MGANAGKGFPQSEGTAALGHLAALAPLAKLAPLNPHKGIALRTGQASPPVGGTPMNPWGRGSGGSGKLPLYRRPGTMPAT